MTCPAKRFAVFIPADSPRAAVMRSQSRERESENDFPLSQSSEVTSSSILSFLLVRAFFCSSSALNASLLRSHGRKSFLQPPPPSPRERGAFATRYALRVAALIHGGWTADER